jgi:hypothetical protein
MGQSHLQTNQQIIVLRIIGLIRQRSNQYHRSGFHDTDRGGMFSGGGNRAQNNLPKAGLLIQALITPNIIYLSNYIRLANC